MERTGRRHSLSLSGGRASSQGGGWARAALGLSLGLLPALWAGPAAAATVSAAAVALPVGIGLAGAAIGAFVCLLLHTRCRRDRDLFRQSLDAVPAARQLVGPDGKVVIANTAFRHMVGDDATPTVAALERQLAGDGDGWERLARLASHAAAGIAGHAEITVKTAEGEIEWRDVTAFPLPQRPGFVLWGVEDITPRRQVEQIIQKEQERFADLVEHAPIGFYSVDEEGRFLFVNETLAAWLGLARDQINAGGLRLHEMVATPLPPGTAPYNPFGGDESPLSGEVVLCGPSGRRFLAYVRQEVVPSESGVGLRTRSIVHDLSRERELEAALQVSEQRFRRFFEEAPVGIALIDGAGRIEECNGAFAEMVEGTPARLRGAALIDFIAEEDRPAAAERLDAVAGGAVPGQPLEIRLSGEAGRTATLYASRREVEPGHPPRPDAEGEGADGPRAQASGLIAHFIDTTEQKKLEVQFTQSQKMQAVGQLAGGIAHDFNNLLTAMIGFCDLLLLRHRAGDQSFADIMQIKQNANRAANLVRQLLAFSRQQTLQPRVLNVTDVLAELSHLLRRLIGENIELQMVHGRDLFPVKVDHGQLEQVIINLAVNARDAMPEGGKLTIRTRNVTVATPVSRGAETMPPGDYVLIEVADTGTGIAPQIIDRIFDPFFSTKEVGSGTGLGLSTVYGIVKQTGGFVFVDSKLGEGSAFGIYLPRHAASAAGDVARVATGADGAGGRDLTGIGTVLLVEDEDAVRLFSARALRNKGYNVLEARSGEAALEIIEQNLDSIDLLITDVVMPRMDGPTLIREVRARRPDIKVIFISGYTEDAFRKRLDEGDDIHFLPKPFSLKQLAGKVKEVMREGTA